MCVCAYVQRSISEISKVAGETQWCGSIKIKPTTCPNHHRSLVCKIHYSFVRNVHTCTHSSHEEQQANKTLTYLVYQKQAQWNLGCEKSQIFSPLRSHFLQTFPILLPSAGVHAASEQRIIIGLHNHHAVQYGCRPSFLPLSLSVLSWPTNQALLCSWVIYAKCNSPETEVNLPVLLALLLQLLHVEKLPLQNAPGFSASNSNPENFITGKGLPPRFAGASWSQEQSGRAGPRTLGEGKGWCVYVKEVGDWQSIFFMKLESNFWQKNRQARRVADLQMGLELPQNDNWSSAGRDQLPRRRYYLFIYLFKAETPGGLQSVKQYSPIAGDI